MADFGSAIKGGFGGAATGATIGSVVPGIGTAIGAGAGGLLGLISSLFGGKPDTRSQVSTQTPQQQQGLSQVLQNMQSLGGQGGNYEAAQNYLGQLLSRDPMAYDRFAEPYLQQFQQKTLPQLSERFAGLGGGLGGGVGGSSGFGQAIGGAAGNLQAQLAQLYSGMQRGAASDVTGQYNQLANLGLGTRAFEPTYQPGNTGLGGGILSGAGSALGQSGGKAIFDKIFEYLSSNGSNKTSGLPSTSTAGQELGFGGAGLFPSGGSFNPYEGPDIGHQ